VSAVDPASLNGRSGAGNRVRLKPDFASRLKLIWVVQMESQKYFAFSEIRIDAIMPPSRTPREGRRDRHERWARDAMDAKVPPDERRWSWTAKTCGPGTPWLVLSWRQCFSHCADDGD
jgi:hypothetical protein